MNDRPIPSSVISAPKTTRSARRWHSRPAGVENHRHICGGGRGSDAAEASDPQLTECLGSHGSGQIGKDPTAVIAVGGPHENSATAVPPRPFSGIMRAITLWLIGVPSARSRYVTPADRHNARKFLAHGDDVLEHGPFPRRRGAGEVIAGHVSERTSSINRRVRAARKSSTY